MTFTHPTRESLDATIGRTLYGYQTFR